MEKFAKANKVFYLQVSSWNVGRSFREFSAKLNKFFSIAETRGNSNPQASFFRIHSILGNGCRWKDFYSCDKFKMDSSPKCAIFVLKLEATHVKWMRWNRIHCRIGHRRMRIHRHIFEIDIASHCFFVTSPPRQGGRLNSKTNRITTRWIALFTLSRLKHRIDKNERPWNGNLQPCFIFLVPRLISFFLLVFIFIANLCEFRLNSPGHNISCASSSII